MASGSTRHENQRSHAPSFLTPSKSSVAPPTVDTDTLELRDMMASSPPPELELKDDIVKLGMLGDEIAVKALLDSGKVAANWVDSEGVGPLHVPLLNAFFPVWSSMEMSVDLVRGNLSGQQ